MISLTVALPWPDSALSPNSRKRWEKINATKAARLLAKVTARSSCELLNIVNDRPLSIVYAFYPPDNRRRDIDNMLSMCKPYQDGIFEALGVNDSRIAHAELVVGASTKGSAGSVIITVTQ